MLRIWAVAIMEFQVERRDPFPLVILFGMPLILLPFAISALAYLSAQADAPIGAENVVPSMALGFAVFSITFNGFPVFRDHAWGTWDRLRASAAEPRHVILGKGVVLFARTLLQQLILFGAGVWLFDMQIAGSWQALLALMCAISLCMVAIGLALAVVSRRFEQFNAIGGLGAIVLIGLGGSFAPIEAFPAWAQTLALFTPSHWGVEGYRACVSGGAQLAEVAVHLAGVSGFAMIAILVAIVFFREQETKETW